MKITARSNGAAREAGQFISGRRQATFQRMVMFERTNQQRNRVVI